MARERGATNQNHGAHEDPPSGRSQNAPPPSTAHRSRRSNQNHGVREQRQQSGQGQNTPPPMAREGGATSFRSGTRNQRGRDDRANEGTPMPSNSGRDPEEDYIRRGPTGATPTPQQGNRSSKFNPEYDEVNSDDYSSHWSNGGFSQEQEELESETAADREEERSQVENAYKQDAPDDDVLDDGVSDVSDEEGGTDERRESS